MRTASLTLALLVAAALAGCTGGTSNEGQIQDSVPPSGTASGSQTPSDTGGPGDNGRRVRGNQSYEAHLEASPGNGTAPLNVTLSFGVTWQDSGRRAGQDPNRTAGSSGNQTSTSPAANRADQGSQGSGEHPLNRGHDDFTWTLEVRANATAGGSGNGTAGNSTAGPGNSTGNATGNQAGSPPLAHGTLVASWNGTGEELPGNRTVTLNATGSYDAVFTVHSEDGIEATNQTAIHVGDPPPGSPLGNETQTFEGSFLVSEPLLCFGAEEHEWVLNATFEGRAADVSRLNATVDAGGVADVELTLLAPNGTQIARGSEIDVEGPFEAGNYTLAAESCVAADVEYTITAIADYTTPGYVAKEKEEEDGA